MGGILTMVAAVMWLVTSPTTSMIVLHPRGSSQNVASEISMTAKFMGFIPKLNPLALAPLGQVPQHLTKPSLNVNNATTCQAKLLRS